MLFNAKLTVGGTQIELMSTYCLEQLGGFLLENHFRSV